MTILAGAGLAGLLGATAYAVASVSIWLVPAYLLLVVAILATPRGPRVPSPAPGTMTEHRGNLDDRDGSLPPHPVALPFGARAITWLLRAGSTIGRRPPTSPSPPRGEGARRSGEGSDPPAIAGQPEPGPDTSSDPAVSTAESDDAGPANLRLDPAATAIPKPRKSRARSRKTAKPAIEPAPDSAAVTWVRIGPGHYVRSDAIHQGQPPVEAPAPAEVPPPVASQDASEAPTPVESQGPTEPAPPVEAPASAEEPPPAGPSPPAEVSDVATPGDPFADRPEPAAIEPPAFIEASPAAEVPEADAPASEEPATIAQPATVAPVASSLPTPEGEATENLPTADGPAMEPTAPEDVPEAGTVTEEYGIAPSAFGPAATEPLMSDGEDAEVLEPIEPTAIDPEPGQVFDSDAPATGPVTAVIGTSRRRRAARAIPLFVPRSLWPRSPAPETRRAPLRRDERGPGRPRAGSRAPKMRDPRRAGVARRAFGRSDCVRPARRARSPPSSS